MIKGFENVTAELTPRELELFPNFVERMKLRVGKSNSVTAKQIASGYLKTKQIKIEQSRIRKMITICRLNGLVPRLVATSSGYYVATTKEELEEYDESLMGREDAIKMLRSNIQNDIRNFNK